MPTNRNVTLSARPKSAFADHVGLFDFKGTFGRPSGQSAGATQSLIIGVAPSDSWAISPDRSRRAEAMPGGSLRLPLVRQLAQQDFGQTFRVHTVDMRSLESATRRDSNHGSENGICAPYSSAVDLDCDWIAHPALRSAWGNPRKEQSLANHAPDFLSRRGGRALPLASRPCSASRLSRASTHFSS